MASALCMSLWLRFAAQPCAAAGALGGRDAGNVREAVLILRLSAEREFCFSRALAAHGAQLPRVSDMQLRETLVEIFGERPAIHRDDLVALLEPGALRLAAFFDDDDDGRLVEIAHRGESDVRDGDAAAIQPQA